MEYNSNTKEVIARIALIRATIAGGAFSDALVAGLNAGMGLMKRRIFNQSLDATGGSLGKYGDPLWKKKRVEKGRQVARKDLEYLGTLRRSIEVVTVNNTKAEVRLTSPATADIARYQEEQIFAIRNGSKSTAGKRVDIFSFSKDEQEISQSVTRELLRESFNF